MAINFPTPTAPGERFTDGNGKVWEWDGDGWLQSVNVTDKPGGGDMQTSVFDTNSSNIVDAGESISLQARTQSGAVSDGQVVHYLASIGDPVQYVEVALAQADNQATMPAMGIARGAITTSGGGRIMTFGQIHWNTTGRTVGDLVYVHPSIAGALTFVEPDPIAGEIVQVIGRVSVIGTAGVGVINFNFQDSVGPALSGDVSGPASSVAGNFATFADTSGKIIADAGAAPGALASLDTVSTAEIDDDAVTNAKLADVPANSLKGNDIGAAGDPKDLTVPEAQTLLNVEDGATANTGALADLDTVGTTQIDDDAVTNAKLADMATDRIKGRDTAATGDPEDLTPDQAQNVLDQATDPYVKPSQTRNWKAGQKKSPAALDWQNGDGPVLVNGLDFDAGTPISGTLGLPTAPAGMAAGDTFEWTIRVRPSGTLSFHADYYHPNNIAPTIEAVSDQDWYTVYGETQYDGTGLVHAIAGHEVWQGGVRQAYTP